MAKDADSPPNAQLTTTTPSPNTLLANHPTELHPFSPPTQYTFTQIIDADHFTIQQIAKRIRRLLPPLTSAPAPVLTTTPPVKPTPQPPTNTAAATVTVTTIATTLSTLKPLLLTATWRLIRHDLSEDLVMRPAFTAILGPEGTQMADHDRLDHASGRKALLAILTDLGDLETVLAAASTSTATAPSSVADRQFLDLSTRITSTFDTLATHMTVESGEFLPAFESTVDTATSQRLAREYARTLVLSPDVTVAVILPNRSGSSPSDVADGHNTKRRKPVFPGGMMEYVNSDLGWLRECYDMVLLDAKQDDGVYMNGMVEKEIEWLQVGKWLSLNERKALKDDAGARSAADDGKGKL